MKVQNRHLTPILLFDFQFARKGLHLKFQNRTFCPSFTARPSLEKKAAVGRRKSALTTCLSVRHAQPRQRSWPRTRQDKFKFHRAFRDPMRTICTGCSGTASHISRQLVRNAPSSQVTLRRPGPGCPCRDK